MAKRMKEIYRAERAKGKSCRQIAHEFGVSYQTVWSATYDGESGCRFRKWTKERCIYPNLRKWLNDNRVTLTGFIVRMDLAASGVTCGRFSGYFRGDCYPTKKVIDKMLQVTGLTYEQMWEVGE